MLKNFLFFVDNNKLFRYYLYMSIGDKIEEELEKMQARRNAIWNDLKDHAVTLSAVTQVTLIAEVASIDNHIRDMKQQLEDMGWQEFMMSIWNEEEPF